MKNKWFNKNLLVNEDSDWWRRILHEDFFDFSSPEGAKKTLRDFYKGYQNHAITDVLLCVMCQCSYVPSAYVTWAGDKALWTHENGIPVDYTKDYAALRKLYCELNVDFVDVFIDTMREGGIRPWITIRMNDTHCNDEKTNFLRGTFFYEAKEKGMYISSGGEDYGYFNCCFDYSHTEVRSMMLNYIREIADRYDMDGIELDFQRELFCFDYKNNRECYKIMNDFMREARKIVNETAKKKGRDILLMARVSPSIEDSLAFGFDVKAWAEEKLVDAVVPTPRWGHCDSGIPVADWKKLVGDNIAVFPGIETLNYSHSFTTYEQAKAYWACFDSAGADGLYTFNMFLLNPSWSSDHYSGRADKVWSLTPEKCLEGARDFTVLGHDTSSGLVPVYAPLPLDISANNTLPLTVGPIKADNKLTLTIDFEGENSPEITIDNIDSVGAREITEIFGIDEETGLLTAKLNRFKALEYTFENVSTEKDIEINFNGNGTVHYVNLRIE